MSRLIKALSLLGLLLLPLAGLAGEATLTWTAPTQNEDGSTLTDRSGYRIYYGTNQSNLDQTITLANPGLLSHVVPNLTPGRWYFAMTTLAGASPYRESARTNIVNKELLAPNPNPPGNLAVQGSVAYTLIKQRDRMVMLPVGTVAAGTPCIADQSANGFFAVPRASVTFSGTVRPEIVFAQCS